MGLVAMAQDDTRRFTPGPDTGPLLREALGRFATGVTVVTVATPQGPVGITANSFTSVSLDPPLVLWCPARASRRFAFFGQAPHFAIHVMAMEQRDLARGFASGAGGFEAEAHSPEGVPLLPGALARFDCALHAAHDGGDHSIVVGRVLRTELRDGAPLVFAGGAFGGFASG